MTGLLRVVGACALALVAATVPAGSASRNQLRVIVQDQCVPHWQQKHDPSPCISVSLSGAGTAASGYAVLADQKGGAHFLLIPTGTISGIESREILTTHAPNYFDAAWKARDVIAKSIERAVPRDAIGLAVNQIHARSQDQLHIHMSCLGQSLYEALKADSGKLGERWSALRIGLFRYQAMRVMGAQLGATNPFELLADRLPGAKDDMGGYTLLVAGADFKEGPGFVLLAGKWVPGAELLLDSHCAVVQAAVP